MYLWKSWHDSRDRVMLYGAAGLAIGVIFGISYIYYLRPVMEAWLRLIPATSPLFLKLPAPVRIVRTQMYQEFLRSSWEWAIDQVLRSEEHSLNSSHPSISYAVFCLKKQISHNTR